MANAYGKKNRRRRRGFMYKLLSSVVICVALVLAITVFFKITAIEVEGNARYTDGEIAGELGIEPGDNLLFISKSTAVGRIFENMPYVDKVAISRKLPGTLVVSVEECRPAAYADVNGARWLIDKNGKVLETVGAEAYAELVRLIGIDILAPSVGRKIAAGQADSAKLGYLVSLLGLMSDKGILGDVAQIDASNAGDLKFSYLGRFTVELGISENLSYKLDYLAEIVSRLAETEKGTIDLSGGGDKKMHFIPDA